MKVVGDNSEGVIYGGAVFSRGDAANKLKDVIDEAVDDYFDNIEWDKAGIALMALAARWIDKGCSNNQSILFINDK